MNPKYEKRRRLKRHVAKAYNDCDRALENIKKLHDLFDGVHKTEADSLVIMAEGLLSVQEMLKAFWTVCWGGVLDSFEGYR